MSRSGRIMIGVGVGIAAALLAWVAHGFPMEGHSDFDQLWIAARAIQAGADPYEAVRRVEAYPLFYPLPAVLLASPMAFFPLELAKVIWGGLGAGLLAYAAFSYKRALPTALLGAGFLNAIVVAQWAPFLTAAAVLPWASVAWVAKPSIGLALLIAYPHRKAFLYGGALLIVSLIAMPSWPGEWFHALRDSIQTPLVLRPGGFILLLAALRWRTPEGRLLTALACVPQTVGLYETLPLFLIPRSRWEGYALATLSFIAAAIQETLAGHTITEFINSKWPSLLLFCYLPALVILLRRPNRPPGSDDPSEPVGERHRVEGAAGAGV